jgi:hypothetical protein
MGDVATFVTLRAAGSPLREMLRPVRWPGTPSWAGSPGSREGSIDLTPTVRPQQFPPARNRTTDWARLRPQGKWL